MTPDDLAAELLAATLDADPLAGSLYGFPGHDHRLPDFSSTAERAQSERLAALATRAGQIDQSGLAEVQLQTLDFVRRMAGNMAGAATVPLVEFTICDTFVDPVDSVLSLLPKLALDTTERQDGYVARLRGLPEMLATVAQRHRDGTAAGRTAVRRLVESTMAKIDLLVTDEAVGGMAFTEHDDATFVDRVATEIDAHVRPALSSYRQSLAVDVLPAARDDEHPGICYLPDGDAMYAKLVQLHTSTRHTPEELHAMGLEIVDQVSEEFRETGSKLWGTTDLTEIFERLTTDRDLRYQSREEMLEHARRVVAAAEAEAPKWFGVVPREACVVEPVPESEEAGMAAAYYLVGAIDGSRKGTYFLNTSKPEERHRYAAEDVAFHEAVPGHHFQLTIALEDTDLVPARRVLFDTASAEGWGLYSERLADEMGLYTDELSRMGLFSADAWRAGRLVVDTGLHAMGWTRAQAVDWLVAHTPMPRIELESEVDRYISYPGQALAYMTGRLEIVRLRREASDRLGDRFDLRTFHDVVLKAGSLPLPALANTVERWVARTLV
jgi:uncharacterized protein (DUF885 family)